LKFKKNRAYDEQHGTHTVRGYSKTTSTGTLRKHLYMSHPQLWVSECKRLGLTIRAKEALGAIAAFQDTRGEPHTQSRQRFTQEGFINAIAEFIIANDQVCSICLLFCFNLTYNAYLQPISIVEAKEFRSLLLLLKGDLQDKDIPHRTTIRKRILELQKEQAESLSADMLVS
jgi:hypothetical protein